MKRRLRFFPMLPHPHSPLRSLRYPWDWKLLGMGVISPQTLPFPERHINGIIQHAVFGVWLLPLRTILLKFIHTGPYSNGSFRFITEQYSIMWVLRLIYPFTCWWTFELFPHKFEIPKEVSREIWEVPFPAFKFCLSFLWGWQRQTNIPATWILERVS